MCHRIRCQQCEGQRFTWEGCGWHVEQALSGLGEDKRCPFYKKGHHPRFKDGSVVKDPSQIQGKELMEENDGCRGCICQ